MGLDESNVLIAPIQNALVRAEAHVTSIAAEACARPRCGSSIRSALNEPRIYRRVPHIVVPSAGLARELGREYPGASEKLELVPNAIDADRMRAPADFDRQRRRTLGFAADDFVLVFVALGQFERKGLPRLPGRWHSFGIRS